MAGRQLKYVREWKPEAGKKTMLGSTLTLAWHMHLAQRNGPYTGSLISNIFPPECHTCLWSDGLPVAPKQTVTSPW